MKQKPRTLYFAEQTHLFRGPDGRVRTDHDHARYESWRQYLLGVDQLVLLARVSARDDDSGVPVEGSGVSVVAVPFYQGPIQFCLRYMKLRLFFRRHLTDKESLYGSRTPNLLGPLVQRRARQLGAKFIAQLIGDPEDVLSSGVAGRLGKILATQARRTVVKQVGEADGVIYVTRGTLQSKYPAREGVQTLVRSNVELQAESFSAGPRNYRDVPISRPLRLVTAGSQEQLYKGHHVLIQAARLLESRGIAVHAVIIGDGRFHNELIEMAEGMEASITFPGYLRGASLVREQILESDVFVMPSLTEGLPRALIEAMATGIVSVGSRVGGIPELLSSDALVEPGDPVALANLIERMVGHPDLMTRLASQQWEEANLIAMSYSGPEILGTFLRSFTTTNE